MNGVGRGYGITIGCTLGNVEVGTNGIDCHSWASRRPQRKNSSQSAKNSKLLFTSFRENNYYLLATEFDERYFCYYPQPISRNSALESANHN